MVQIVSAKSERLGRNFDDLIVVRFRMSLDVFLRDNGFLFGLLFEFFGLGFGAIIGWLLFGGSWFLLGVCLHLAPNLLKFHDVRLVVEIVGPFC